MSLLRAGLYYLFTSCYFAEAVENGGAYVLYILDPGDVGVQGQVYHGFLTPLSDTVPASSQLLHRSPERSTSIFVPHQFKFQRLTCLTFNPYMNPTTLQPYPNPNKDQQQQLATLNYLCAANGHVLPSTHCCYLPLELG